MPNLTVDPQPQDNLSSSLGLDPQRGSNPLKAIFIGILIFVLLSATAYGAYWYTKNYLVSPSSQSTISNVQPEIAQPKNSFSNLNNQATPSTTDEMEGWKTFEDKKVGVSLKYPASWATKSKEVQGSNANFIVDLDPTVIKKGRVAPSAISVFYLDNPKNLSLKEYEKVNTDMTGMGLGPNVYSTQAEEITRGSVTALYLDNKSAQCEPVLCEKYVFEDENRVYELVSMYDSETEGKEQKPVLDQILSTFKFL